MHSVKNKKELNTKKLSVSVVDAMIDKSKKEAKTKKISKNKRKKSKTSKKKLKLKKSVYYFLIVILIGTFLYSTGKIIFNVLDMKKSQKDHENLLHEVLKTKKVPVVDKETGEIIEEENIEVDFDKLLSINKDIVGWIRFNKNKVNYPIAQGDDNNYYLRRNLDLKYSTAGTIFLDYRNASFDNQNAILFGHAMSDKTMFGTLEDVFHGEFWKNPENIEIKTPEYTYIYQIFSYYTIEKEEYYITPSFSTEKEFQDFINTIKSRSWQTLNVPVTVKDNILTLSTCVGTGQTTKRRVIHAVRISAEKAS